VTAVYVNLDDEATQKLREKWQQWGSGVNLVVVASPYRSLGPAAIQLRRSGAAEFT
jgi:hypothetical protein